MVTNVGSKKCINLFVQVGDELRGIFFMVSPICLNARHNVGTALCLDARGACRADEIELTKIQDDFGCSSTLPTTWSIVSGAKDVPGPDASPPGIFLKAEGDPPPGGGDG